ncbi:MAG: hypothetical protein IPK60_06315 [Sandaracinaceae bacterium]|nr:hypothetical protein [Sandaracinaceae bacterium]
MNAYIEVIQPDGSAERHRIDGDQTTVGRSPAAGISLPGVAGLDAEHLLVQPRPEGCFIAVHTGSPRARVNGREFDSEIFPWGTEVEVAGLRLKILDTAPQDEKSKDKKTSPVIFLALAVIPILLWTFLETEDQSLPQASGRAPELFAAVNACPATGVSAQSVADDDSEIAEAKAERYAFAAQDGIDAVRLFGIANRCYAAVGRTNDAARMERKRVAISHLIESDYRNHRLRLERALKYERWEDALVATTALQELTRHLDNEYTSYLSNLSRRLQAILAAIAAEPPA